MKRRLDDTELARLRRVYEEKMVGTHEICRRFLIRRDDLTKLARDGGWKMRRVTVDSRVEKLRWALEMALEYWYDDRLPDDMDRLKLCRAILKETESP